MQRHARAARLVLLGAFALAATGHALAAGEVIDRVLAVVAGNVITLSETRAAIALGFFDVGGAADPVAVTLKALIEQELVLDEVNRSTAPGPDEALVTERVGRIRARFPDAGAYRRVLTANGLDEAGVQEMARDVLRVKQYLDRRFEAVLSPSDDEVRDYYRANPEQFTHDGQLQSLDDARTTIVARFIETRRRQAVDSWMARLRRRADVVELYVPRAR
jgi:hypothetical protein